jgi:hypothetical protein
MRRAILIGVGVVLLGAIPAFGQRLEREPYPDEHSRLANPLRGGRIVRESDSEPAPEPRVLWRRPWQRPAPGPRPVDVLKRRYEDRFLAPPRQPGPPSPPPPPYTSVVGWAQRSLWGY